MSELLSQHVLQHYDKFVAGIDEVARVEEDLVAAYQTVKARFPNFIPQLGTFNALQDSGL